MKAKYLLIIFSILVSMSFSCTTQGSFYAPQADQGYVDLQLFYDQLSPYGQWIEDPQYGYVWVPDAGSDFVPYDTNGEWVMTEYGWTWVSGYPWGWAPFHYGRWDYDNDLGWYWIPGNEWGPAWVVWRRAEGYYGWAPMRPGMRVGYYGEINNINYWHFVPDRDFGREHIHRYELEHRDYDRLLRNSTVIDNTHIDRRRNATYIAGPSPQEVERHSGRRISSLAVRDNSRPGTVVNKNEVRIFRPRIEQNSRRVAPANVAPRNQINTQPGRPSQDNNYLPNQRRNEKMQQMNRSQMEQQQMERQQMNRQQMQQQQIEKQQMNRQQMEQQQQNQQRQLNQEQQRINQQQQQINQQQNLNRRQQRRLEMDQRRQQSRPPLNEQKREEFRKEKTAPVQPQQTPENNPDEGGRRR